MTLTVFHSLKYSFNNDSDSLIAIMKIIPRDIHTYWYTRYFMSSGDFDMYCAALKRLLAQYDTPECEIAAYYGRKVS